jgi:Kae1-associated kinase Bud32
MELRTVTTEKGAEADISISKFLDRDSIVKTRLSKEYRHKELDDRIRISRMKNEARILREARKAGVRTPVIYDIDTKTCSLVMERIEGITVKNILNDENCEWKPICMEIGKTVADLHNARISHGDLTTSNMILMKNKTICLIDMSLGKSPADLEDLGVDIHLLERAFSSAHPHLPDALEVLISSYTEHSDCGQDTIDKMEEIRSRGRYT